MPPKPKVTKENIITAAVNIVRESGASALNARAVASALGVSTQPIFSNYDSMDELKRDVIAAADRLYQEFSAQEINSGKYPVYKASGMAYIRFSMEERELFRLLFMRDRSGEEIAPETEEFKALIQLIQKNTGLNESDAHLFHAEMWVFVHGIATMAATSYLEWDKELVSRMLTDGYEGLKARFNMLELR